MNSLRINWVFSKSVVRIIRFQELINIVLSSYLQHNNERNVDNERGDRDKCLAHVRSHISSGEKVGRTHSQGPTQGRLRVLTAPPTSVHDLQGIYLL